MFLASTNLKFTFDEKQSKEMYSFGLEILVEMIQSENKYIGEYLAVDNYRILLYNFPPNENFYLRLLKDTLESLGVVDA